MRALFSSRIVPIRLCFMICLLPLLLVCDNGAQAAEADYVQLVLDFGDGFQKRYGQITPRVEMTVFGTLEAAARHPRGFEFEHRGSGETAFVTSIDGQANEGGGGEAKNWRFYRNGQLGKQGAGLEPVKAGDVVLWKFESGS